MSWKVPLADIDLGIEESQAVQDVLDSGWLTMGARTEAFEEAFAAAHRARYAIAVTNATAGLHLACEALGLKTGDEVILPALTFVASAAAVLHSGARPVFADIQSHTDLTLSPQAVERAVTPQTRAIMVMHYGGYACDMPALTGIAERHNLALIEDAAHAPGASLQGRHLGTWGQIGVFSFFSNKNMTSAEGGMLLTDDEQLAQQLRLLRSHGMTSLTWDRHQGHAFSYDVIALGYNYRIDEIRSAIGLAQLHKLEEHNARRRHWIELYHALLAQAAPDLERPFKDHPGVSAGHLFPILLPAGEDRHRFMEAMKIAGVQTSIHYPPLHQFSFYRRLDANRSSLPQTESVGARQVSLPLYASMGLSAIELVVDAVAKALVPHP